jgi:hypothetical protein
MIVMLSAHRKRHIPRGARSPRDGLVHAARWPLGSAVWSARDTPGRTGRARLVTTLHLWTKIALSVDDVTGQSFFLTHPVDGISAGS